MRVISRLNRKDVVTLSLPGFGCPLPAGFSATKEAYVDWLLGRLAALPRPIDLVGHDWGALLVVRAVSLRPDAVRSWAAGGAPLDREYVWHQAAQGVADGRDGREGDGGNDAGGSRGGARRGGRPGRGRGEDGRAASIPP